MTGRGKDRGRDEEKKREKRAIERVTGQAKTRGQLGLQKNPHREQFTSSWTGVINSGSTNATVFLATYIYRSRGKIEKVINRFETAIEIASSFGWADPLSRNHYLAQLGENRFGDPHAYIGRVKLYATDSDRGGDAGRVLV